MNVRWMAVLTGFMVDIVVTFLLYAMFFPQVAFSSDTVPNTPLSIALGLLATGVGGYVAGRMAPAQRVLHGLLVGVVGILVVQLQLAFGSGPSLSRTDVLALAIGCLAGTIGGVLSRYPAQRQMR